MSSSDDGDNIPLAARQRNGTGSRPATAKPAKPMSDSDDNAPIASRAPKPKLVKVKPDPFSSEDDEPIVARKPKPKATKPKPKAAPAKAKAKAAPAKKGAAAKKGKPAAVKKGAVKKEEKEGDPAPKKAPKFEMPGQTRETPADEKDPLRVFYSSLYEQSDHESEMATKWMLMYGLLETGALRRRPWRASRQGKGRAPVKGTPSKAAPKTAKRPASSTGPLSPAPRKKLAVA
eukprot:jgi/Tetstr1/428495/TSEL_018506.t1